MKILVTGCAGFIGFHLSSYLLKKNINVIGIDNINEYYDINLKKNRLKFSELTDVDGASDYKADEGLEIKELNNDLDKALSLLPPKCKQVFLMSRVDGLKYQQIADVMDISIKTVEAQMSKALKIFKNNLKRE